MFSYEDSKSVEVTTCCTRNQSMSKQERYDRCIIYQGKECRVINCAKSTIKLIQRQMNNTLMSPPLQSIIPINQSNLKSHHTSLLPMYQRDRHLLSTGDMNINRPCRMIPIQTDLKGIAFPTDNT
ncbi:hypothetical protein ARMGADRAFT_1011931 [Armillaria gallica]|uniref:Uncharacterized protein n=1 Tax=Armillaria gallica TaxID=47427 RepID=A0A2H3DUG8_ARMGA|nr:hypothetical protein ARMGADRAFT_1011931 [Armillaria gallica]